MVDFIVTAIVVALVALAATYIVREKKRGVKCIGCRTCSQHHGGVSCSGSCGTGSRISQ